MKRIYVKTALSLVVAIALIAAFSAEGAKKATLTIVPSSFAVKVEKTKQFSVKVTGGISKDVTWYIKYEETTGTGDGTTTVFELKSENLEENTEVIIVSGETKTKDTDYTIDYVNGTVTFTTAPATGEEITASYYTGSGNSDVGAIDETGLYTAPAKDVLTSNPMSVELKAVSVDKPKVSGKAIVKVYTPPSIISLQITPKTVSPIVGNTEDFVLKAEMKGKAGVKWFVNDIEGGNSSIGTIKSSGLLKARYKAPSKLPTNAVIVKAVSSINENIFAKAKVTVEDELIAIGIPTNIDLGQVVIGRNITSPPQESFTIKTKSGEPIGWQVSSAPQWLQVTPRSGTTPDLILIEIYDTGRLNEGLNIEPLIFQSSDKKVNSLTLDISVNAISDF